MLLHVTLFAHRTLAHAPLAHSKKTHGHNNHGEACATEQAKHNPGRIDHGPLIRFCNEAGSTHALTRRRRRRLRRLRRRLS